MSQTSARSLQQSHVDPNHHERIVLSGFPELLVAFAKDNAFNDWALETPADDMLSLTKDGLVKIIISGAVWTEPESLRPYLELARRHEITLICIGTEQELSTLPDVCRTPEVLTLGLPVTLESLRSTMHSLHKCQQLIVSTNRERHVVQEAAENVKYVMSISRELNGERDIPKLLNLILYKAREICRADAGSIYTIESPTNNIREGTIRFRLTQNHSIAQNLSEFKMPVNEHSIVGSAVIHQQSINIPDLYKLSTDPKQNPFGAMHDRTWDRRIGYESHSMLTLPMFDISHQVIGVIQLINRKKNPETRLLGSEDFAREVVPFDDADREYAEIVAQQAGIALENAGMHEEITKLFDGFVNASVKAIEQRDPTTSGHSHRVATLTCELAKVVDRIDVGPYKSVSFSEDQMREIQYASLLHDFGKLGVREAVLVKAKKLYPWQMDLLHQRFELIRATYEIEHLRAMVNFLQAPAIFPMGTTVEQFEAERDKKLSGLEEFLDFILKANEPTVLEQGGFERLKDIANLAFKDTRGNTRAYLLSDELKALSVSRGSLTSEEFNEIQSHVTHTYEFLRQIPWGKRLTNVPQIAAKHHEKLDGTGYPTQAAQEEIPIQSRIMTIADIFDALTASDRPYKRAVPLEKALDILNMEVKGGKIDNELFKLFTETRVYKNVLNPPRY
jgi:HD-GYP domain-containing protein (c-di-GMP phosphodiesterase class II)